MKIDIDLIIEGLNGKGAIYVSNQQAAKSLEVLKNHNIGAVISLTKKAKFNHSLENVPKYLYINVEDKDSSNITQYFQTTYKFIEEARRVTNVLIHCIAEISRSPTILLAYIIKKYEYSLSTAFNIVKKKRNKIYPNQGFIKQLQQYFIMTRRQKVEKKKNPEVKQIKQIKLSPLKIQAIKIQGKEKSITLKPPQIKEDFPKTLQKNKRNLSTIIIKPKIHDDFNANPKIYKKIERLKTSIVNNSNVFQDNIYLTEQQKFSELLKLKIYKNKQRLK